MLVKETQNGFTINFKETLEIEDSELDLSLFENNDFTKKAFKNRKKEFTEQLNFLINTLNINNKDFAELFFAYAINMTLASPKLKDVIKSATDLLTYMREPINVFVDTLKESYTSPKPLEEMNTASKRELYFSDDHLKRLLKVIIASKFLYTYLNNNDNKIRSSIVEVLMTFNFVPSDKGVNIKNKLQKFCYSRILSTIYSDKRFWNMAKHHNILPMSYANSLYVKFTTSVLSFVDWDKNPIPYLDVYIQNNLTWLKQQNFNHSFVMVGQSNQEIQFDNLASNYTYGFRFENQATNFIIKVSIEQMIQTKLKPYMDKNPAYRDLLLSIYDKMKRNVIYNFILFPYISKVLKISTDRLLLLDKKTVSMLILYLVIELEKYNFVLLPKMMLSNITTDRLNISKKRVESYKNIASMLDNPRYKTLLETKFDELSDIITDEKYLLRIVSTMYYNKFLTFGDEQELKFSANEIIDEVLKFYELML